MQTPRNFVPCQIADWYEQAPVNSFDAQSEPRVDQSQSDVTLMRTGELAMEGGTP